jgi:hypothetical protein
MKVAPLAHSSQYFAFAAAVTGISGGLAAMAGGFLAQLNIVGGLLGLFALSAVLRLIALLPLIFVREPHSKSIVDLAVKILPFKAKPLSVVV